MESKQSNTNRRSHLNMESNLISSEIFICECHSIEHQLMFHYDTELEQLSCDVHLSPYYNFFQRIWFSIKYIFGYKCQYGNFDTMIFKEKDMKTLRRFLDDNVVIGLDLKKMSASLDDYLKSEKCKTDMDEYFDKIQKSKEIIENQICKTYLKYGLNIDEVMSKIYDKYESRKYIDREYKAGREPTCFLYDFFYEYAKTFGKVYDKNDANDIFEVNSYQLGNFIFSLISGQGSFVRVTKI